MPLAAVAAIGAIGSSIAGGIGASKAAGAQQSAANYAANLQKQEADAALDFQRQVYADTQKQQQPFLQAGQSAIGELSKMYGTGGPQWNQTFQAPTEVTEQNDPGYQARLQMGQQALERSAAARGNLLTGGTAKALERYGQNYASNEYGNVYNRALNTYQTNYNTFQQNAANLYNRLAGIAGTGQVSAGQLAGAGQSAANNIGSIDMNLGQQLGNDANIAGGARASGYAGIANSIGGGINNLSSLLFLQKILGKG